VRGVYRRARPTSSAEWRIPTVVLIRKPKVAVPSFALRDPISVDQALRYYLSFYETVEEYRDAYVLGLFEEITEDFGEVIRRINDRFETTFSPFTHDERNVDGVLASRKIPGGGSGRHPWRTRSLAPAPPERSSSAMWDTNWRTRNVGI
jgi:hypothetical protein